MFGRGGSAAVLRARGPGPRAAPPDLRVSRLRSAPVQPAGRCVAAHAALAGGAHHTCYSQNLTAEHLQDFAEIAGLEYVSIDANTEIYRFKNELKWNEVYYQLKSR